MRIAKSVFRSCQNYLRGRDRVSPPQSYAVSLGVEALETRTVLSTTTSVDSIAEPDLFSNSTPPLTPTAPASTTSVTTIGQEDLPAWAQDKLALDNGEFVSAFRGHNDAYVVHYTTDGAPEVLFRDARLREAVSLVDFIESRLNNRGLDGLFGLSLKAVTEIRDLDVTANEGDADLLEVSGKVVYEDGFTQNESDFVLTIVTSSPNREFDNTGVINAARNNASFVGPLPLLTVPVAEPEVRNFLGPLLPISTQTTDRFEISFFDSLAPIAPEENDQGTTTPEGEQYDDLLDRPNARNRVAPNAERRLRDRDESDTADGNATDEDDKQELDDDVKDDDVRDEVVKDEDVKDEDVRDEAIQTETEKNKTPENDTESTDASEDNATDNRQAPDDSRPRNDTSTNASSRSDRRAVLSPSAVDLFFSDLGKLNQSPLDGRATLELHSAPPFAAENSLQPNSMAPPNAVSPQSPQTTDSHPAQARNALEAHVGRILTVS